MRTRMAWVSFGALCVMASHASAQQQLVADRVEASMVIAGDHEPLPIHEERLTVAVDGEHATSTLLQTFTNASSARIEGLYHLRPGSGSHVDGFAYWNGETKIVGEVFEREAARKVYERVTTKRRDPGLLEEDGEGAFAFKVFPIEPREAKRVEVRWTQWLPRHAQLVHYRAPLTSRDAQIVVTLAGPIKHVTSTTHKLLVEKVAGGLRLRATGVASSGELDLDWEVDEPAWTPDAYVQSAGNADEGWFSLSLAAPQLPESTVTAKDMTIVIDRSGSMEGDKIDHAKIAATDMIRLLNADDRVNVIPFSDEVDPLFAAPQPLTADTRTAATSFIHRLHAGGGTDIALALTTSLRSQEHGGERPHIVVFLTDGQSDAVKAAAVDTTGIRLFTLGLGADVNKPLLSRLASQQHGRFIFIEDAKSIESEVGRLAATIAKPLLVDVAVEVVGAQATRMYPRSLPDLFAEDELRVSGRLRGTGAVKFIIHGKLAGKPVSYERSADLAHAPKRPWIAALWAQSRVDHLLEEIALGGDQKQEQTNEVIELALAYNFITPFTAFLAIPESELGAEASTVAAMRERKQKVLAANPEVAAVRGVHNARDVGGADADGDDDDAKPSKKRRVAKADVDEADAPDAPRDMVYHEATGTTGHHGCAGCATGGSGGSALLLIVAVGGLVLRRRRR